MTKLFDAKKRKKDIFALFVDMSNAYNKVNLNILE